MSGSLTVPGKVLFYGAYSVLIKGHISLSLAVADKEGRGVTANYKRGKRSIASHQFDLLVEPSLNKKELTLVEYPYLVAELFLKSKGLWKGDVEIELFNSPIFGDKDEKSGLGSSAAAVVAVSKALFEANDVDTASHLDTIHKLSQIAYAFFAQKIGSGFDIATSTYGKSIVYQRYDPSAITLPSHLSEDVFKKAVFESLEREWEGLSVTPIDLDVGLLVFNIGGAKTSSISAVKAWKEWKKSNEEEFKVLMNKQDEIERKAIEALKARDFAAVRHYTHEARAVHREMQEKIKAIVPDFDPVEPEPLSRIIEEAEKLPGIVAGRCPGAGGWDSLAFITDGSTVDVGKIIEAGEKEGLKLSALDVKLI